MQALKRESIHTIGKKKDGELIVRWDNAPHQKVKTFPHHKHLSDGTIIESYETQLEKVLRNIENDVLK